MKIKSDERGFQIGFDVGGTFTDLVLLDEKNLVVSTAKTPTTPDDIAVGAVDAIKRLLDTAGVAPRQVSRLVHATTQTSNALNY